MGLERLGLQRRADQLLDLEPAFRDLYARCSPYTMTTVERMYAVFQAAGHVARAGIAGDYVECGVWRGGSSMMAALSSRAPATPAARCGSTTRSRACRSRPRRTLPTRSSAPTCKTQWAGTRPATTTTGATPRSTRCAPTCAAPGVAEERLRLVKGKVEETIPGESVPDSIALLRLDTDWYESTKHELEHLYPRLEPGGC